MKYIKEFWGSGNNKDFNGYYEFNVKDRYKFIGFDVVDIKDYNLIEINKDNIEKYISLNTIKNMFPIYNKINFKDDWSVRIYRYKDYILIYKSAYYYTFKKIT